MNVVCRKDFSEFMIKKLFVANMGQFTFLLSLSGYYDSFDQVGVKELTSYDYFKVFQDLN